MDHRLIETCIKNGHSVPDVLCEDIETLTNLEWRRLRQKGIGGSDAGAIYLNKGKFKTAFDVSLDKTIEIEDEEVDPNDAFRFDYGHLVERLLGEWYAKTHNAIVFNDRGMYVKDGIHLADGDGFAVLEDGEVIGLEYKSTSPHNKDLWRSGVYGDGGEIGIYDYYCQVQHYMAVFGLNRYDILVDFKEGLAKDIVVVTVNRDDDFIKNLLEKEKYFWNHLDEVEIPKRVSDKNYPKVVKRLRDIGYEVDGLDIVCNEYQRLNSVKKELKKQMDDIDEQLNAQKAIIVSSMDEDEEKVTVGNYIISNKTVVTKRYDTTELKKHKELNSFLKECLSFRFSIKEMRVQN